HYTVERVRISSDIIPQLVSVPREFQDEYSRISRMMDAGNEARRRTGDHSVLALGVAAKISSVRPQSEGLPTYYPRRACIITSLEHPEEVARLRELYPQGFYLLGVYADEKRRHAFLVNDRQLTPMQAEELMRRDEDEQLEHGQRTSDTFHLSDFF